MLQVGLGQPTAAMLSPVIAGSLSAWTVFNRSVTDEAIIARLRERVDELEVMLIMGVLTTTK